MRKSGIEKTHPELLKEWDWEKNNAYGIFPKQITYGSGKKVWWVCPLHHSYEMRIKSKTCSYQNCSYCSGRMVLKEASLQTTHPHLLQEWDYKRNKMSPIEVSYGSNKKVWWICSKNPSHKWKAQVYTRTSKYPSNCPFCSNNYSKGHQEVVEYIKTITTEKIIINNKKTIKNPETGRFLELDIYFPDKKIAIEYNGVYYHSFDENQQRDKKKQQLCEEKQIKLLTIWENEWKNNQEGVKQIIRDFIL